MAITNFVGKHAFLSNFFEHPHHKITYAGLEFNHVEGAYQAAKCRDIEDRKLFLERSPAYTKKLGKSVGLRPDWEFAKVGFMEMFLRQKFQDEVLLQQLLETGDEELVEGNWWNDTFWGVCNGVGENHLGKLLMMIREEYRERHTPNNG